MKEIRDIQKRYCSQAMLFSIVGAVVLIIIGQKAIGKGLVLGTIFSIINFIIIGQTIPFKLARSHSRPKAGILSLSSIVFRFAILSVPLIISVKIDAVHLIGVIIGLFMVQLTLLFNHLILDRFPASRKSLNRLKSWTN
jgi:hypothetical protein